MTKRYATAVTVFFTAFLGVFFVLHLMMPDRSFSEEENRSLTQMPRFSLQAIASGSFMSEFDTYATDQFPWRQFWIEQKANLERLSGKQVNRDVYFCGDRLIADFQISDEALLAQNLAYVQTFTERCRVPVHVSLIPNAAHIWRDRLPTGAPVDDQGAVLSAAEALSSYYSTYAVMAAHAEEEIYFRTDHHWTPLGAYYGYQALMQALGREPVSLETYEYTPVSTQFIGTSGNRAAASWIAPDELGYYVPERFDGQLYDYSALETTGQYAFFLGGNAPLRVVQGNAEEAPKLLLLRDSHADALVPFLTAHFSEIHLIDLRYYKQSVQAYIAAQEIDEVVVLYGVSNFVDDANLFVLALD